MTPSVNLVPLVYQLRLRRRQRLRLWRAGLIVATACAGAGWLALLQVRGALAQLERRARAVDQSSAQARDEIVSADAQCRRFEERLGLALDLFQPQPWTGLIGSLAELAPPDLYLLRLQVAHELEAPPPPARQPAGAKPAAGARPAAPTEVVRVTFSGTVGTYEHLHEFMRKVRETGNWRSVTIDDWRRDSEASDGRLRFTATCVLSESAL